MSDITIKKKYNLDQGNPGFIDNRYVDLKDGSYAKAMAIRRDYFSELALGKIPGRSCFKKFGIAPSGGQTTPTDVWDLADASTTSQLWVAPTAARVHAIVSDAVADTAGGAGVAAVKVYGLLNWTTAETSETVVVSGTYPVNTVNSYIIIHRMKVLPQATTTSAGGNAGTIKATAAVDGTITAVILPGNGQTEMAVYGVPSIQTALIHSWRGQIDKATGAASAADFILRVNENPDVQLPAFLRKDDISVQSTGSNSVSNEHKLPLKFPGPCIIKVQAETSVNDLDCEAGFDLELVTN